MKKLLSMILVLCLTIGLVACAKPADKNPTEPTVTEPLSPTESANPTESTEDPDAIYREVKIQTATYSEMLEKQEGDTTALKISGVVVDLVNTIPEKSHIEYRVESWVKIAEDDIKNCRIEKYDGETKLWSTLIKSFTLNGYTVVSDGIIAYGSAGTLGKPYIAKFSETGEFQWELKLENPEIVGINAVVENADGSYAAFSTGWVREDQCICLNQVSTDGKVILFKTNAIGKNTIGAVARVGDGYWLRIGYDEFAVVRMDAAGNIIDSLSFGEENANYCINSIVEYNGKVYMSGNSSPKIAERRFDTANGQVLFDINALCEDVDAEAKKVWEDAGGGHNLELENLKYDITDRIKNHYTAMLLVLDGETGCPLEYYYAKESFGGKLVINEDGTLLWCVKNVVEAYRTPLSCSSYWDAECLVYRCILDSAGKMISVEKTDDIADWYFN